MRSLFLLYFTLEASVAIVSPYVQIILRNKGYSQGLTGVVLAIGEIATTIVPLLVCNYADRSGKTRFLLFLCSFISAFLFIPICTGNSLFLVVLCYFLAQGLFGSLNSLADGFSNRCLEGNNGKYGAIRAFGSFGYVICLIFFGLTGIPDEKNNLSILKMIILIALFFCISILVTPEDPNIKVKVKKEKEPFSFKFFSSSYYLMLFIIAITRIGNSVIDRLLSSYMVEVLNVGSRFTLFVALGAFSEMFMLIFGSKLVQKGKTSPWFMIVLSTAGLFLRLLLFRFSKNLGIFALAQVFHMFTFGALHVGITAFMTENVEPQHYTLAMSFYWSVASFFPLSIGSFFGGFIIDAFGYDTLFTTYMVFPLIALFMLFIFKNFLTGKKKE